MDTRLHDFIRKIDYLIPQMQKGLLFSKEMKKSCLREISISQMVVLTLLKDGEKTIMKDIAKALSVTTSAATGLVDRMVKSDFLERVSNPNDRRIISIRMTKQGKKLIDKIAQQRRHLLVRVFGKLSQKERDAYLAILEKIRRILQSEEK